MAASSDIQFIAETHRYYVGGVEVPNVTRILEPIGERYDFVPFDVMERKRIIGDLTHKATALYDAGLLDNDSVDDTIAPYVDAWKKFVADAGFVPLAIEDRVYHNQYRYAGTLDRVGYLNLDVEGPLYLIDIKCRDSMPPDAGPQTAAYAAAWCYPEMLITERRIVLLRGTGEYRCITPPETYNHDLGVFLACLNVYNHNAKYRR